MLWHGVEQTVLRGDVELAAPALTVGHAVQLQRFFILIGEPDHLVMWLGVMAKALVLRQQASEPQVVGVCPVQAGGAHRRRGVAAAGLPVSLAFGDTGDMIL